MKKSIAIIGYSGHAYVVLDILKGLEIVSFGYYEKSELAKNPFDLKYLGHEKNIEPEIIKKEQIGLFVAIGDNILRRKITEQIVSLELKTETIISPKSVISATANIDFGSLISSGVIINSLSEIGKGVIINTNATIEHEVKVGDFSHIAPGVVLLGNVEIGENTFIGANATIKQGIKIGNNVLVGAGAVVLKNIPNNEKWVGNPAKKI